MHICLVLGTRPEIIKLAPIIRVLEAQKIPFTIVHSNQHYSPEMDRIFFDDLRLPAPDHNLDVGSGSHGQQTGLMLQRLEPILAGLEPDFVLVQGDTNTVLAGALVAVKLGLPVGHVEAGLRSWDRGMPEEHNRVVADHLSDMLFTPTEGATANLRAEGIGLPRSASTIVETGNTVVDAIRAHVELALERPVLSQLELEQGHYLVVTAHRPATVDDPAHLASLLSCLEVVAADQDCPIVFPIHPRTLARINEFNLQERFESIPGIMVQSPLGYLDFLQLESAARVILTDSGGIQEEACVLDVPCVTLRDNTERPETVQVGKNIIAGLDPDSVLAATQQILSRPLPPDQPFGDGHAAEATIEAIRGWLDT